MPTPQTTVETSAVTEKRLPPSVLQQYFKEAAAIPMLKPHEEQAIAQSIEQLESALWGHLLSYPALLEPILALLLARLEPPHPNLETLRRMARELRRSCRAPGRRRYDAACERLGAELRERDLDREVLEDLMCRLERLGRGEETQLFGQPVRIKVASKAFSAFLRRARELAEASQAERHRFVRANLRLVMSIVYRHGHGQLPLHDLIQEGNLGLIKAVGRFDYKRGYRFSTYAGWWIRHAVNRAIANKGRLVRMPVHQLDSQRKITKATWKLTSSLGRPPTEEELSDSMGVTQEKLDVLQQSSSSPALSLDKSLGEDGGQRFIDLLDDEDRPSPSDEAMQRELSEHVLRLVDALTPMEADVLRRRFGLASGSEETLQEVGERYGLSRERIRQIQEEALTHLRRELQKQRAI